MISTDQPTLAEAFVVCRGYCPPEGYKPTLENPMFAPNYGTLCDSRRRFDAKRLSSDEAVNQLCGINRVVVPFVACGDLGGFDSDGSYPLSTPTIPSGPLSSEYASTT